MKLTLLCTISLLFSAPAYLKAQHSCQLAVPVMALDQKINEPVDSLSAGDFRAKFGRSEITVRNLKTPQAKRLIFVLDRSRSMPTPTFGGHDSRCYPGMVANQALSEAVSAIPRTDLVAFIATAGQCTRRTGFMRPDTAKVRLADVLAWNPESNCSLKTRLWDNIAFALTMFNLPAPGDTIIVVSDGGDNASKVSPSKLRGKLLGADVPVLAILITSLEEMTPEARAGPPNLADFAEMTGGAFAVAGKIPQDLPRDGHSPLRVTQLLSLLAHEYELTVDIPALSEAKSWQLSVRTADGGKDMKLLYPPYLYPCAAAK